MSKSCSFASVTFMPDESPGGLVATVMRALARSTSSAAGTTLIAPDGTVLYITRAEAERFIFEQNAGEVKQ